MLKVIPWNNLREKDYSFDYAKQPSMNLRTAERDILWYSGFNAPRKGYNFGVQLP